MDIRTLQYFVEIVDSGNFSNAAKKLHITQPPLSRQIRQLEEELGVVLMQRGPREITLTDAGKQLYKYASSIIDLSNLAITDINDYSQGKKGSLKIGTASSCSELLLSIASSFSKKYPDISYQIFEANTFELIDLLEKNTIEIAFVRSPFQKKESLQTEVISEEEILAVAHPHFFNADREMMSVNELDGKPVIIYRRWEYVFRNFFHGLGISPIYFCINDDARTSLAWAKKGMEIALLPSSAVVNNDDSIVLSKKFEDNLLKTKISIAWKDSQYMSQPLKNFIEVVRELMR